VSSRGREPRSHTSTTLPIMPRALRPSVVVTVSLSVAACVAPPPPAGTPPTEAPPPAAPTSPRAPEAASAPPLVVAAPATGAGGFRDHPRDEAGRVIYRRKNGVCFVEIVESAAERRFRFDDVACAPAMNDPAYQACDNGEIRVKGDGCVCARLGNPPKPPFAVACPQQ
jgi:hypothetical protein